MVKATVGWFRGGIGPAGASEEFVVTGLQRVLKTVEHTEPDRVPVGEWGIDHDHVSRILGRETFWRNRRAVTLALWEGRRDEVVAGSIRDYIDLVEALDYDVVPVGLAPPKGDAPEDPPKKVDEGVWRDRAGRTWKYAASNDSIMRVGEPAPARESIPDDEFERICERVLTIDESQFEYVDAIGERFGRSRAVVFRDLDTYAPMVASFGGDQAHRMMLTAIAPEQIKRFTDVTVEHNRRLLQRCAGRGVTVAMQGADYGSTTGLMWSPQTIRELFMPVHKGVAEASVELGMIPFFHCCGRIWDILDDWIDAGMRGYQSVQATAGMDLAEVKSRHGDRLTLWAGLNCETLTDGTAEQLETEVLTNLEIGMPGGGLIFGANNSVQFGADTDLYLRALELVRTRGRY